MRVEPDGIGALFGVTSDAVIVLDAGRVVAWNPRAERLFGVPAAEAVGAAHTPLSPHLDDLLALAPDGAPTALHLPPHGTVEALRRVADGRDVLVLRDVTSMQRQADGLRRLASLSRDLLREPQSLHVTLQTLVTEAKAMTGADYSALMLLREGTTTETTHFVYDAPRHLFPERMPRFVGLLQLPLQTRQPARLARIEGHPGSGGLPEGHPPIGALLAVPLTAGDVLLGELTVGNDPSRRTFDELDEVLLVDLAAHAAVAVRWAQSAEASREQARRRQEVVDAARHDIRTPLGAGKGYAALLASRMDRMSPTQVSTALDGLRASFDRIEAFSARLLVDEQLSDAPPALRWAQIDLPPLLERLRLDAAAVTGRTDAVHVHLPGCAPTSLAGDPEQVREVLDNLVGNALKYAGHAGPVTVTVRSEGDQVRLDVHDEGPGIAEDEQGDLFERWSRTDASRAALQPGLGLGLSIVRRMVVSHGGTLGVSSRVGEGATFWVTFPASVPAGAAS